MRTIDADALGDAFAEKKDMNPIDGNGGYLSIEEIYEAIDNAPTVEQPRGGLSMKSEIDFLNRLTQDWSNDINRLERERDTLNEQIARLKGIIVDRKLARDVLLDRLHELKGGEEE